jgi:hypothetical protein
MVGEKSFLSLHKRLSWYHLTRIALHLQYDKLVVLVLVITYAKWSNGVVVFLGRLRIEFTLTGTLQHVYCLLKAERGLHAMPHAPPIDNKSSCCDIGLLIGVLVFGLLKLAVSEEMEVLWKDDSEAIP